MFRFDRVDLNFEFGQFFNNVNVCNFYDHKSKNSYDDFFLLLIIGKLVISSCLTSFLNRALTVTVKLIRKLESFVRLRPSLFLRKYIYRTKCGPANGHK